MIECAMHNEVTQLVNEEELHWKDVNNDQEIGSED